MPNLSICSKAIRVKNGLYSLNDLHKAAGGSSKHTPFRFTRLAQTKELIAEVEQAPDVVLACETVHGGSNNGTWVCKQLVYAYAMWISPKFSLHVINAFDAMQTPTALPAPTIPRELQAAIEERLALYTGRAHINIRRTLEQLATNAHQQFPADSVEKFRDWSWQSQLVLLTREEIDRVQTAAGFLVHQVERFNATIQERTH